MSLIKALLLRRNACWKFAKGLFAREEFMVVDSSLYAIIWHLY